MDVKRSTDDGKRRTEDIDAVFICRSGSWTPPLPDHDFAAFVHACPITAAYQRQDISPRDFDLEETQDIVKATRTGMS